MNILNKKTLEDDPLNKMKTLFSMKYKFINVGIHRRTKKNFFPPHVVKSFKQ